MGKPTLTLSFIVGPCGPSQCGYFIKNVSRNVGIMVTPQLWNECKMLDEVS